MTARVIRFQTIVVRSSVFVLVLASALAACKSDNPAPDLPDARRPDASVDASTACFDPGGSPPGCFQQDVCEPVEDVDFLNGCTDGTCIAFDNAARLPLFNNGNLPPLP